ncbi:MAG: peptide chain release factor 3 [Alphaproteobacteria bacterium]|nr:peptide chain release factor 3 [Alphaproteobacteria bacterium]
MTLHSYPRRTFAIISHPDAGKTTLTEKLLLFGGAIQMAGAVKARGEQRRARSDWMKVEQERGISVTASVMTFQYENHIFNLLDTPGHEDFSEDTYRTLTAVDSVIMVLDVAKGIETQTRKLFEVCRLRDIPIITFINKLDREGRDPFSLLDEIEKTLALEVAPVSWPIGMGREFSGCYDLVQNHLIAFERSKGYVVNESKVFNDLQDSSLSKFLSEPLRQQLINDIDMIKGIYPSFDLDLYRAGHLTPVYFGSAVNNFGIHELLRGLINFAPSPRPQKTVQRMVEPHENKVTGFVFKIQANMDPKHRDRIAFIRLCSGHFKRGSKLLHVRSGKIMAIHNPILFMAQDRQLAEEAFAGDIIGILNHGNLHIGDALSEGEKLSFMDIPSFAPEFLQTVRSEDPMKMKHLVKALIELAEEGVARVFKPRLGLDWIVGVVGPLQFDILADRMRNEYGLPVKFEAFNIHAVRWIDSEDHLLIKRFVALNEASIADDHLDRHVFLARNLWHMERTQEEWPQIKFLKLAQSK